MLGIKGIEAATTLLDGVVGCCQPGHWGIAAIVSAFTYDTGGGRPSKSVKNFTLLNITEFAALGIRGLSSRPSVIKYRQAWENAIEQGWAEPAEPGKRSVLPEQPFEKIEASQRSARIAELLSNGFAVANFEGRMSFRSNPHLGRSILVDAGNSTALARMSEKADQPMIQSATFDHIGTAMSSLRLAHGPTALSPYDAYRVFMLRGTDALMLGNYLILRDQQPAWPIDEESLTNA